MPDYRVTLSTRVKQVCALADGDLNEWEKRFVENLEERTQDGKNVEELSDKQIAVVDRLWDKHFA